MRGTMRFRLSLIVFALLATDATLVQPSSADAARYPIHLGRTGVRAATEQASTQPGEKIDPAKEAEVRELLKLTGASKTMGQMVDNMTRILSDQSQSVLRRNAAGEERRQQFNEAFVAKFRAKLNPQQMEDLVIPIYARHLSLEDLQGLVQFYKSPLGQKVIQELPGILQESIAAGSQLGQKVALEVLREMAKDYPEIRSLLPAESPATPTTPPGPPQE